MNKIIKILDKFIDLIGGIAAIAMVLMLLNVFYDVVMRYFFKNSSIGMQEMEWHLFAVVFLFGMAYALKEDGHVRVDMFYERMNPKKQALINMIGAFVFIVPFALIIINSGYAFALDALELNEISGDPGGLTNRWIIKGAIATSFVFLLISTVAFVLKNGAVLFDSQDIERHDHKEEVL
ncbi:TRAP transporter small permease subunit [Arcobacteraceae bacterium]|jgi:TRAP-type mannitol/chloroaromatic compound transport system permease small subunit|nr:TRAP transporter small permease subunit [Arcobacteraceae bacterium]